MEDRYAGSAVVYNWKKIVLRGSESGEGSRRKK